MGRNNKNEERQTIRKCKECGKEFTANWHINYCKKCYSNEMRHRTKAYFRKNGEWKTKLKWRQKLMTCKTNQPVKEEWNETYNPSITREPCTYCGENHSEDQKYFHPYTRKVVSLALEITDIEKLIKEVWERTQEGKSWQRIRNEIGMNPEELVLE